MFYRNCRLTEDAVHAVLHQRPMPELRPLAACCPAPSPRSSAPSHRPPAPSLGPPAPIRPAHQVSSPLAPSGIPGLGFFLGVMGLGSAAPAPTPPQCTAGQPTLRCQCSASCAQNFPSTTALYAHMQDEHQRYACRSHCNRHFGSPSALTQHYAEVEKQRGAKVAQR